MDKKLVIHPIEANKDIWKILKDFTVFFSEMATNTNILEVYIGGGFGRREGSVIYKENVYITSNDYDMFIIYDGNDISDIKQLIGRIRNIKKMQNFDIEYISLSKMKSYVEKHYLSQSVFDFLKGCVCIWKNIRLPNRTQFLDELMNKCIKKKYKVCMFSAYDVLRTRLWCIISPMEFDRTAIRFDQTYKSHIFRCFQLIKACTAIIDAILIIENKYDSAKYTDKIVLFLNSKFAKRYSAECNIVARIVKGKIINDVEFDLCDSKVEEIVHIYTITIDYCKRKWVYIYYVLFRELYKIYAILRNKTYSKNLSLCENKKLKNYQIYYYLLNQIKIDLRAQYEN